MNHKILGVSFSALKKPCCAIGFCLYLLLLAVYPCIAAGPIVDSHSQQSQDEFFMAKALEQAKLSWQQGDHPVGSVLVKDGCIVGVAQNTVFTDKAITHHAEMNLLKKVCRDFGLKSLEGYTLYTNCEPCPMCSGAIIYLKVGAVVYGASQDFIASLIPGHDSLGISKMTSLIGQGPEVRGPVLKEQCEKVLLDYAAEYRRKHGLR